MKTFLAFALLAGVAVAVSCGTSPAGGAAGKDPARFFQVKCNGCHPNGGDGAGPAIDISLATSTLERGKVSGRHAVPEAEWDGLIGYLNQRFASGAAVVGAPVPVAAAPVPVAAAPVPVAAAPVPVAAAPVPVAAAPVSVAAAPLGDAAAGSAYYQAKCNRCHPNGAKGIGPAIAGKAVPGVLQATATAGRHNVPPGDMPNLVAYLVQLGGVMAGAPAVAAPAPAPMPPPQPGIAPLPAPAPAPAPAPGVTPAAGMVNCQCSCMCPPNTPPAALPAACTCNCQCPR
jgi:mono/diheme cytochrome c family protein